MPPPKRNGTLYKPLLSSTEAMGDLQKKLQELSDSYQGLQGGERICIQCRRLLIFHVELSSAVESRQRLESQQQENSTVKKVRSKISYQPNTY